MSALVSSFRTVTQNVTGPTRLFRLVIIGSVLLCAGWWHVSGPAYDRDVNALCGRHEFTARRTGDAVIRRTKAGKLAHGDGPIDIECFTRLVRTLCAKIHYASRPF
jgi:hypothetical protein